MRGVGRAACSIRFTGFAGGMALATLPSGQAFARFNDILGDVRGLHIAISVAGVTGVGRVVRYVTRCTFQLSLVAVIKHKRVLRQLCRTPTFGGVAAHAVGTEVPGVNVRFFVAACAVTRHTGEHALGVTVLAGEFAVFALADEYFRMVEIAHPV